MDQYATRLSNPNDNSSFAAELNSKDKIGLPGYCKHAICFNCFLSNYQSKIWPSIDELAACESLQNFTEVTAVLCTR